MLSLVVRVINQGIDVIDELTVKVLHPIHVVDVEGVIRGVRAGCLDESSGTQSLAVGEVLLQGDTVPVVYFEGNESVVVVAMADTGVHADTAGELAISAEGRCIEGTVQHAALEVKSRNCGATRATSNAALVQSRPQTPHFLVLEVGELLGDDSSGAVGEA